MSAIGFGMNVTGGGKKPGRILVTKGKDSGPGTLKDAIDEANAAKGRAMEIVIMTNVEPYEEGKSDKDKLIVTARNLTIRAEGGAVINRNHLIFDGTKADNILLTNLRFDSDGLSKPYDNISIDATEGRGEIGFWIYHCSFEAYKDLSITTNTRDKKGEPPLLITISHCRFHDRSPNAGSDHGALGIHGTGGDDDKRSDPGDRETNAYATVYRNYFETVRRRQPRSSQRTFVHAFNNVLRNWGNGDPNPDPKDQVNAMVSGNFGILAAEANYFDAGVFKSTIQVARGKEPGQLIVGTDQYVNLYVNGALDPLKDPLNDLPLKVPKDSTKAVAAYYDAVKQKIPQRDPMTQALSNTIKAEAGPLPG
jgi:pectate lyase